MEIAFAHVALNCANISVTEQFYTRHLGFRRVRTVVDGEASVVFIRCGSVCLELFQATQAPPLPRPGAAGYLFPGLRHIAFTVPDVAALLSQLGPDATITMGPLDFDDFIPGWRSAWISDPDGTIVEISQGYCDEQ